MKKSRVGKILNWVLGLVIAGLVFKLVVLDWYDLENKLTVWRRVADIEAGREVGRAREALYGVDNRGLVVDALKDALESEDGSVRGKIEIIRTLRIWREVRAARRALDSDVLSTRRAAAWVFHGDETVRPEVVKIVAAWIGDEGADARSMAAQLVGQLQLKEAVPHLLKALDETPRSAQDTQFLVAAISALSRLRPEGFGPKVLALAKRKEVDLEVRRTAFSVIAHLEDLPTGEVRDLLLTTLTDRSSGDLLRQQAAVALRRTAFAGEEVWKALEEVLFAKGEDLVLQRHCLSSLGESAPLDHFRRTILDTRVWKHDYFGIKVDVATALAVLNVRERFALDILIEYLGDEDRMDTQNLVQQEAWLTLWVLTGLKHGLKTEDEGLFSNRPRPFREEKAMREHFRSASWTRVGVTQEMVRAVTAVAEEKGEMARIGEIYTQMKERIVQGWREEEEAKPPEKEKEEEKEEEAGGAEEPAGPPPPK
jgi:HEAT repeat protein